MIVSKLGRSAIRIGWRELMRRFRDGKGGETGTMWAKSNPSMSCQTRWPQSQELMTEIPLTELAHGGGCGCKLAPGLLAEILAQTPSGVIPPELMVGIENNDDAAVWRLNDSQALVATTDFFTPIVDDPSDFGRIAATNALSDI